MKVKGLILFAVLLLVAVAYAAISHQIVRPSGTANQSGNEYHLVCSIDDTAIADTIYSDTVEVLDASRVNIHLEIGSWTWPDSMIGNTNNESLMVVIHTITSFGGSFEKIIYWDTINDTIPLAEATLDGTVTDFHHFDADTLLGSKLWFRTIIVDSFIDSNTVATDTLVWRAKYHVTQRTCE